MARFLIAAGLLLLLAGVLIYYKVPLGRLPGDIVVEREHLRFYFPITTSLLASLVFSLVLYLLNKLK